MVLWLNVSDKEHLALRNNFRVTKKFLITKLDCKYTLCLFSFKTLAIKNFTSKNSDLDKMQSSSEVVGVLSFQCPHLCHLQKFSNSKV